jgi:Bacterial surface proteins containing Ig-like domains
MKKITVSILSVLMMLSMVFSSSVFAAEKEVSAWDAFLGLFGAQTSDVSDVGVEYRGHVENKGDFPLDGTWIQGPDQLGTVGEGLRLEAFWIKLAEDAPAGLHIKYQVHVQNKGWMGFVNDGAMAGTEGEGLRIEAIQISLVDDEGDIAQGYSVEYRGHVQNIGDTEWYTDGAQLGTTGSGLRLEALEIKIVQTKADMTAYEAAVAEAATFTESDYSADSWAALEAALAVVVTEDNTQAEVDAATAGINDAIAGLTVVLKVESVSAINGNQFKVVFNAPVDKTTAETAANYTLEVNGSAVTPANWKAQLLDDNKSVILSNSTGTPYANNTVILASGNSYKLTIENVLDTKYNKIGKYTSTVGAFIDADAPVVTKAEYKDGTVKIYFNKPVTPAGATYKVDGSATSAVVTSVINKEEYYYQFTPTADQKTIGDHVVTLYAVSDSLATPNTAPVLSATYSVSGDITAPAVTSLTADGMYTFKVKFTEAINAPAPTNVVVKKGALELVTSSVVVDSLDPTIYTVTVGDVDSSNKVYATGETSVALAVTVKGYSDLVGNVGADYNSTVTLSKDTTPPTVVNAGLNKGVVVVGAANDQLNITFNEDLSTTYSVDGVDDTKITVKKDGVILTSIGTSSVINDANGKPRVVVINLGADLVQGIYTVDFAAAAVEDLALVKNVAVSTTVNYTNSSVFIGATITTPDTNVFGIAFAGGVDMSDSATTLANYTLDGANLPVGTTIGFYGDKQNVRITLPSGTVVNNSTALLKISKDVVNKDGVRVLASASPDVEQTGSVTITDNVKPVLSEAKYYVNATTDTTSALINVKFNENLAAVTDNAATRKNLKVTINGVEQTVTSITDGTAGDKYVTLTLGTAVNVNQAATILVLPEDADNPTILITDVAGNKATASSSVITSGTEINPAVSTDAAAVAADTAALAITYGAGETATTVKTDVTLPTTGANGSTVSWAVTSGTAIATNGTVARPIFSAGDDAVVLTATISKGLSSDTKVFNLTVLKNDFTATAQTVNDDTFTITPDGYALTDFAVGAANQINFVTSLNDTVTINGITYTVTYASGTGIATVTPTAGTATATEVATTTDISVILDGKTVTLTVNIPGVTLGDAFGTVVVTIS